MYNDIEAAADNDAVMDEVLANLRTAKWRSAARKKMWINRLSYWFATGVMLWGAAGLAYLLKWYPPNVIPWLAGYAGMLFVIIGFGTYRMPD